VGGSALTAADGMGGEEKWSKLAKRGPKWSKLAKRGPKSLKPESGKNSELRALFIK
jgi:hypothetical protein